MIPSSDFPRLTAINRRITSPASTDYNCVAWSAGDTERWWQPGVYWPISTPRGDYSLGILDQTFRALGYEDCDDGGLEPGFEKVALYWLNALLHPRRAPTAQWEVDEQIGTRGRHRTRLPSRRRWGGYGDIMQFMRRSIREVSP